MGKRMPVIFSGHGSPMIALEQNDITEGMKKIGKKVISEYGKPKAILAVSAHWYTRGTFTQSTKDPSQIYDMYGFPRELYQVKYPVHGDQALTDRIKGLLGNQVSIDDSWGIDHGTWTVLVHMFPKADIPVVQLSVDGTLTSEECFEIGKKLAPLREEGYLIFGSGNIVLVDVSDLEFFERSFLHRVYAGDKNQQAHNAGNKAMQSPSSFHAFEGKQGEYKEKQSGIN